MSQTPEYVAERIRRPIPAGVPVVAGSTPVVAFGDIRTARVATLGLNPSKVEFLDRNGRLLSGDSQRLESLVSVSCTDLASATDAVVQKIFNGCNGYFGLRPYNWFNKLERVLRHCGASYFDGTACHLDLVQWATDPVWGKLKRETRQTLLEADVPFLRRQLSQEHIELLLLNGMQIVRECEKRLSVPLLEETDHNRGRIRFFSGRTVEGIVCIGWNLNLQSSFGVSNKEMDAVGEALAAIFNAQSASTKLPDGEVIIELGVEGGGQTVYGRRVGGGWDFWSQGTSMDLDENDDEVWRDWKTPEVSNLNSALPKIWPLMHPSDIHPDFVQWFRAAYSVAVAALPLHEAKIHNRYLKRRWQESLRQTDGG